MKNDKGIELLYVNLLQILPASTRTVYHVSFIMSVAWQRLIRFVATDGRVLRGDPILPHKAYDLGSVTAEDKLQAKVIVGYDIYDTTGATFVSDESVTVARILGPLTAADVPVLRCVGLNYSKHSR